MKRRLHYISSNNKRYCNNCKFSLLTRNILKNTNHHKYRYKNCYQFQHRTVNYKEPTAYSYRRIRRRKPFGTDCGSSTGRGAVKMQNSTAAIALRSGHQDILLNTRRKSLLTKGKHPLTRYARNSYLSWMEHLNDILDDNISRRPLFD